MESLESLEITARERDGGQNVWIKDVPLSTLVPIGILEADGFFPEFRIVLRLADGSDIFMSAEQATAIAEAVAKVNA